MEKITSNDEFIDCLVNKLIQRRIHRPFSKEKIRQIIMGAKFKTR